MRRILISEGVPPERLTLDQDSRDTLQNVVAAARFIRTSGLEGAVICTDVYHAPRVAMLFRVLGVSSERGPLACGRGTTSLAHWSFMTLREVAAYAYDFAVIMHRARELREVVSRT
jgi:uncharacterized SAM-binding protein YcdF (DUF218 family)